ncbi:MAG: TRAP transporter large permease [Gammaproteobacteria bacterium]|uniref:TRAP transporter large permease protein n=1 Tax=Marinomonas polaris DSM 16579 TaxID=1122206 RepID=A0A1M4YUS4_9GAMM|nr:MULTISPECIES: TRAP transporter large permease [Marinomonas]MBU1466208.1 TRAP transporter large permease [Gammaproteobacteria bacterium]MBU2024253.1 TRAP transporter large permease [Gammaproteobacteria bacterium]MBU2238795.1 TRAP transporter large permease [Gammaproteobacteria bacterium]MBU2317394.1 TRAP transporter large permease [Gammaproteobacteria bacterium]MBU2413902.1 TRAP transporter large permease [Gammaproteobacteria bacterium]|tara:strand:- start:75636 stop:76922 length:1287 start_codon:yes stop_codon:yes gene_type:complete
MSTSMIGMVCIAAMLLLIALRAPVALTMALAGFVGFGWIVAFDPAVSILASGPFETLSNYSFSPIPMFILMGVFASKSGMSQELFQGARAMFGSWRGGMGLAAVTSCGIFSAISGSSMATAASMSRVALPEMEKNGYAPTLATGVLAAGGTLGIMIPPSIALLLYALITEQSVGAMFIAGVIPGLLGLVMYGLTVAVLVTVFPNIAQPGKATTLKEKFLGLKGLVPFTGVFVFIIGGIYTGWFTPTEASAVGAGATLSIALVRGMRFAQFKEAVGETLIMSAMIFFMIIGAEIFGYFLSVSRISFALVEYVDSLHLGPYMVLFCVLILFMLLGCVMDSIAMLLLTVPVVYPLIEAAGFDPIWFGIVAVITVELGLITPPVGMNVFVIKSVAPHISIGDMYKGVMPFVISDLLRLALIVAFPVLAVGLL